MIVEVVQNLSDIGLLVNELKTAWITDKSSFATSGNVKLVVNGASVGLLKSLDILGSRVSMNNSQEPETIQEAPRAPLEPPSCGCG